MNVSDSDSDAKAYIAIQRFEARSLALREVEHQLQLLRADGETDIRNVIASVRGLAARPEGESLGDANEAGA